ncbi:MAG: SH3 domain-containing protein [Candidatus Methylomirabilia bacterium]
MQVKGWRLWCGLLVLLGAVDLAGPAMVHAADFVRVKVEMANVREGPGTQFTRVWRAYRNDPLRVVERKGQWLKVEDFEGYKGWIYAPLTDAKPAVIVKGVQKWANIRLRPGLDQPVVHRADRGVSFRLLEEKGQWLQVQHADGDRGWIYRPLVWGDGVNGKTGIRFVRVKVATANIREGPGTNTARLWKVGKNYPLRVVSRRGQWFETVDFEGYEGWIFAPLTDTRSAVVVKANRGNLRSGPGTDYRVVSSVLAGTTFRVLDRKDQWVKVEGLGGTQGWMHSTVVWGD